MKLRFVEKDPLRNKNFQDMIQKISEVGNINPETVRTFGIRALKAYGERRLKTIFTLPADQQTHEINYLKQYFERYMRAIVDTNDQLQKVMNIAENSIEDLFRGVY